VPYIVDVMLNTVERGSGSFQGIAGRKESAADRIKTIALTPENLGT
jgi:hypothetical protein